MSKLDEPSLPINGRQIVREIVEYCQNLVVELIGESEGFAEVRDKMQGADSPEKRAPIFKQIIEDFDKSLSALTSPLNDGRLFDSLLEVGKSLTIDLKIYDQPIGEIRKLYSDKLSLSIESRDEILSGDKLDFAMALSLIWFVAQYKAYEEQLIKKYSGDYFEIANRLDGKLTTLVSFYANAKAARIGRKLLNQSLDKKLRNSTKGSVKNDKKAIFDGFIGWALKLPGGHGFRFAIDAANYYLEHVLSGDLKRHKSDRTAATAVEKLNRHCRAENIPSPITGKYFD